MTNHNDVAIITGASKGLGRALARLLARRGNRLVINARRGDELRDAERELAAFTDVVAVEGDVSEIAEEIAGRALQEFGRIDLLINNASTLGRSPMPKLEHHSWQSLLQIYKINVVAPLHLAQLVIPGMRLRHNGMIANITSDAGVNAYPGWGGYGSSKAALLHASRILSKELEGSGIQVFAIDPGDMNTEMHRLAEPGVDLSHLPSPDEVAPRILAEIDPQPLRAVI